MKAMNFQDDIPSNPFHYFKDQCVLGFDLTSMQDVTEKRHFPKLVGEPLRLELSFTSPLGLDTELNVLGERMSSVAVNKLGVVGKNSKLDYLSLQQLINGDLLLMYWYLGSFLSENLPILDNDAFAIINTQRSKMQ